MQKIVLVSCNKLSGTFFRIFEMSSTQQCPFDLDCHGERVIPKMNFALHCSENTHNLLSIYLYHVCIFSNSYLTGICIILSNELAQFPCKKSVENPISMIDIQEYKLKIWNSNFLLKKKKYVEVKAHNI